MSLPRIYPVGELAAYLRELLENDQELHDCWVAGEVSNVSQSGHGHYYFTIKDEDSQIRCVLFRNDAMWQTVLPENGAAIVAHGYVSVYEATGNLQLYVDMLQAEGKGALFMAFERLKAMMDAQGLFAEDRKRPLPEMPRRIGIVTSPQAATPVAALRRREHEEGTRSRDERATCRDARHGRIRASAAGAALALAPGRSRPAAPGRHGGPHVGAPAPQAGSRPRAGQRQPGQA